jgi:nucleoid DNA-binding protein
VEGLRLGTAVLKISTTRALPVYTGPIIINWSLTMNRTELIAKLVASNPDVSKVAAGRILDTLIDTIQVAVKKGDTVSLVGFGSFKAVKRAARTGKNPSTGAALKILASTVPKFTAGSKFKAVVDPKMAARKAAKAAPAVAAPVKAAAKKSKK